MKSVQDREITVLLNLEISTVVDAAFTAGPIFRFIEP